MILKVNHLAKSYGNVHPITDVNCEINKGDVIAIIGPSGTGKSTFINCLNQLELPDGGEVWLDGENVLVKGADLKKLRRRMGMVFQSFNLFPHLTVVENIMRAPIDLLGVSTTDAYNDAMKLLDTVGLAEKALSFPTELSGGQQQRVAIVRALAMKPEIVLFDEPTSALDPTMVDEVLTVIKTLANKGLTMIIVTHEMRFAREIATRVFYMDEGIVYEEGTPEQIFDNPTKDKTRYFIKRLKVFEYDVPKTGFDYPGFVTALNTFAYKQMISGVVANRLSLVFEELCLQILRKNMDETIHFVATYEEQTGAIELSVEYPGKNWNPLDNESKDDELSVKIIEKSVKDLNYQYDKGTNRFTMNLG